MRKAFFETLQETADIDSDIFLLSADLGFKLFDSFRLRHPERFYDMGIAEANMIGVAAGLSLSGKNAYCYSMAPFLVMRAYEQIRVDIAYHNLNVKLVGVGAGLSYGLEGFTHLGLEDLALMRSLPNMTVVVPADPWEARCLARASYTHQGPLYIRLGKIGDPMVHSKEPYFEIGQPIEVCEGNDLAIIAAGTMVHAGASVVDILLRHQISSTLVSMHTVKPLNQEAILDLAHRHPAIFSLEEHNLNGGLGSAVAEVLAESGYRGLFRRIGIPEPLPRIVGDANRLREASGLSPDKVADTILSALDGRV
jgi:transketolase